MISFNDVISYYMFCQQLLASGVEEPADKTHLLPGEEEALANIKPPRGPSAVSTPLPKRRPHRVDDDMLEVERCAIVLLYCLYCEYFIDIYFRYKSTVVLNV